MTLAIIIRTCPIAVLLLAVQLALHGQSLPVTTASIEDTPSLELSHTTASLLGLPNTTFSPLWFLQSAAAPALNDVVRSLAYADGDLYVGGDFSFVDDLMINHIGRWDGSSWHQLGEGVNGPVQTVLVDGDKVYVGGNFTQAGAVHTRNIAVWDRTTNTWSGFGGGVGGTVQSGVSAIAVHEGQVYVAGSFIAAGKIVAANIARWDGRKWHRVGTGINDVVRELFIEGDYLYAGGKFTIAGDVRASGIARYNLRNERWENIGIDIHGNVTAIASDAQYLYVGGVFDSLEGVKVNNIIRIDKGSGDWSPMYKGLTAYSYVTGGVGLIKAIETILVHEGRVYAGGTFPQTTILRDGREILIGIYGLALWDGEMWSNLSRAPEPIGPSKDRTAPTNIYALSPAGDGTLAIGGDFHLIRNIVGPTPSPYLCRLSIADTIYSPFGSGTSTKGDEIKSAIGSDEAEEDLDRVSKGCSDSHMPAPHLGAGNPDQSGLAAAGSMASVPDDDYWLPVESYTSNDHGILALAADAGEVYAGGTFIDLYGVRTNGIAVRRDKTWFPLDDGSSVGVNGFVYAIAISGSKVYVGGQFTKAGGIDARNIAMWDRSTGRWHALGNGVSDPGDHPSFVSAIVVRGDDIYVGGAFTTAGEVEAKSVARWSTGAWTSLGAGIDGTVNTLEFYQGNLYAGGSFTRAGDINSSGIAFWDGQKWNGMDGGVDGYVNDIVLYTRVWTTDTLLAVGGAFTRGFEGWAETTQNLSWWDGTRWIPMGHPGSPTEAEGSLIEVDGEIRDMMMVGHDLYIAGSFDNAVPRTTGGSWQPLNGIAFLNWWILANANLPTPIWHSLQGGVNGNVNAMAILGDEIFFGGDFTRTYNGALSADHVALWNLTEQNWMWAGNPTALAPVDALAMHDDTLYASGSFLAHEIGLFDNTNYVVRLTPAGWRIVDGAVRGKAFSLFSAPNDEIVVGGTLVSSDENISVNICRWNSGTREWNPLTPGSGVASLEDISFVSAAVADGENVYVAGDFDIADTLSVRNIACWNRVTGTWRSLGEGLNGTVYALALAPDGTLYAGGAFGMSGSTRVTRVARWDGTAWQPLGDGLDGTVHSLAVADGMLYVGGIFQNAGSVPVLNVAGWDITSQTWSPLGQGLTADFTPSVNALMVSKGRLFAAGRFDISGVDSMRNIARWNAGGWWEAMGSGTDRLVNALSPGPTPGSIFAGGYFFTAGAKPFRYVGLWHDPTLSVSAGSADASMNLLTGGNPNPFTSETTLSLHLPEGKSRHLTLRLFDPVGREIETLLNGSLPAGDHTLTVDGEKLAPGIYLLRLESDEKTESVKLVKR